MSTQTLSFRRRVLLLAALAIVLALLLIATYALTREDDASGDQTKVTLFLSFVPSVQFAPVYVAAQRGYFAEEGIAIAFESGNEADGVERIANNDLQFGLISGEQVVLARGNGRPVVYVFEWFHRFPVGIVSPARLNITQPADLVGRVVSVPMQQGASYIGLRALLNAAGLTKDDLGELRSIGFTAVENICEDKVEASVVYIVNEPLTIQRQCTEVNVIEVSDYATLVSNGLVTNDQTIRDRPELVRGMVRAMQRGVADAIADPDAAFDISVTHYVQELPEDQYETQRQVLLESVKLWHSDALGLTNPEAWAVTQDILIEAGLLTAPLDDLSACYNMDFLPEQP